MQVFVHVSIAAIVTCMPDLMAGDFPPKHLLMILLRWELGPLVCPANIVAWLLTAFGACLSFAQALKCSPNRARWILAFHISLAATYLLPIALLVFGTYIGP